MGMRIERGRTKKILQLSQFDYIRKLLRKFNMVKLKPTLTPLSTLIQLSDRESSSTEVEKEPLKHVAYMPVVGSFMYAMVAT